MLWNRRSPEARSHLCVCRSLLPHDLCHGRSSSRWLPAHDGVITHLEPDILECEVKWALESITRNKANGGDGIPVELFQILKDDAVKVLHSIYLQIWKTQQRLQDWERSDFIPIPKNAKTTTQLHSSHALVM